MSGDGGGEGGGQGQRLMKGIYLLCRLTIASISKDMYAKIKAQVYSVP